MAKLVHPDATSCSFAGKEYPPGEDGSFEVPDEAVPALVESHGFTPAPAPVSAATEKSEKPKKGK